MVYETECLIDNNKPMFGDKELLSQIATTVRGLSIDAIEAAGCGHPGLPLGCAEIAAVLYGSALRHYPKQPNWINRDRFVLSAGHGSMLLYSVLHLANFGLSIEDLKQFRQMGSPTAGHPEYGEAAGIETTTGPLGQGVATAAGMALGQKLMQAKFDPNNQYQLLDAQVVALAGDGCLMEGISAEAASLAGHLKLDNLTVIYDANDICLDGPIEECLSEDVGARFASYGWAVQSVDGHDLEALDDTMASARTSDRPTLIIAKTVIGKGSPNREGTSEAHGKALGADETALTKQALGLDGVDPFHVPESVRQYFSQLEDAQSQAYADWEARLADWRRANPELSREWDVHVARELSADMAQAIANTEAKANCATRVSSQAVLQTLESSVPYVYGGSADLSCSDSTFMKASQAVTASDFSQRNIKYGVREFAMAAMASGLYLQGMITPFCGTFMTFSDYMRNAIRVAALMKINVIYQFTHDSILLGEDGPTHQPVEHLASLRAMPGLTVYRPADTTEVKGAWIQALKTQGPVAIVLTRQGVPDLAETSIDKVSKGAYVVKQESGAQDLCILATGSELSLALNVATELESNGKSVRVVSMPSFEQFELQSADYQEVVLGSASQYCSIEAQSSFGWHRYIGRDGVAISVDRFGQSAPASDLAREYGLTQDAIVERLLAS